MLDARDQELILELSSASLDRSPNKNWVENAGGLPPYIRKLARAIEKRGKSLSSAIAIAIGRAKTWARGGGDVDADTRAKAAKAVAQWEALKAKSKVKFSNDEGEFLLLAGVSSYNTEIVRAAWDATYRVNASGTDLASQGDQWIRELGSDYIIVESYDGGGKPAKHTRYPYEVTADLEVVFGEGTQLKQVWVEDNSPLTLSESRALADVLLPATKTPLERIVALSKKQ